MTRRKTPSAGPSMFAEWVIGTSLQSYIPKPGPKPKRRDVIRVEVTTDDEGESDTLKITYPRLGSLDNNSPESIKKVRFKDKPKSALKQNKSGSDANTSASSEATTDSETATDSEAECEDAKAKKKKSKNKDELDPHPTCKCMKCVKGRQKQKLEKKNQEKSSTESSAAPEKKGQSRKDKKKDKGGKKENRNDGKVDSSATEGDTSEGEKTEDDKAGKKGSDKKESKKDEKKDGKKDEEKDEKKDQKKADGDKSTEKEEDKKIDKGKTANGAESVSLEKQKACPEAYPFYHPRLPNLIGPIRAQVIQTEPVVETSEDPPPNAFYDAEHNIMRVYHGPVYGNHFSRSLYPKRDQTKRPLPVGMPHPAQNPYLFGFKNLPIPEGQDSSPVWAHHGFPPGEQPPPPPPPLQHHRHQHPQHRQISNGNGSKGAFSRGVTGPNDDVAGRNNVTPAAAENPYYSPMRNKSVFSDIGSNRSAGNGSLRDGAGNSPNRNGSANGPNQSNAWAQPNTNQEPAPDWDNSAPHNTWKGSTNNNGTGDQNAGWSASTDTNNNDNTWGDNNASSSNNNQETWAGNTGSNENNQNSWGNQEDNSNGNNAVSWGDGNNENSTTWNNEPAPEQPQPKQAQDQWNNNPVNNVGPMPGSWNYEQPSGGAWQDASMAATTNGKINFW